MIVIKMMNMLIIRTSQEVIHPSTTLAQTHLMCSFDGIRCISARMNFYGQTADYVRSERRCEVN